MTFSFSAAKRNETADEVRARGLLPGVLYGPEMEPVSLAVDYNQFAKLYNEAGESSLLDFTLDNKGEPIKTLIQEVQYDPVKGRMIHFDLRQIKMSEEMTAKVELVFVGESAAVKEQGGTLVKALGEVEVKCLPKDLVSEIKVDISFLATFDDVIRVKDLPLPAGIKLTIEPETTVVKVNAPLTDEQIKAMEEEGQKGVEAVEVTEEGKKEESEEEKEPSAGAQGKEEKKDEEKKE